MKLILILVLFCVVFAEDRLIRFNETYQIWLSESEVKRLSEYSPPIHFMDITDYPDLDGKVTPKNFFIPVNPRHPTVVRPLLSRVSGNSIINTIQFLSSFTTRYYTSPTGVASAQQLMERYRNIAASRPEWNIKVEPFTHSWAQPSIIVTIPGTVNSNEIVVIGGHIDSTSSGSTAPGADDDASGSSTVFEVFKVLVAGNFRPQRTIEFHGYAAEEVGLRGSADIAANYANAGKGVVSMLQLDMTGYVRAGTTPTFGIVTDWTHSGLTAFMRRLIEVYITDHNPRSWTNTACGYACSDHASWNRNGYADAFVFESAFSNSNPYIHTPNDVLSRLDTNHMEFFGKLGVAYAVELSFTE